MDSAENILSQKFDAIIHPSKTMNAGDGTIELLPNKSDDDVIMPQIENRISALTRLPDTPGNQFL